jgi:hypothetical protein
MADANQNATNRPRREVNYHHLEGGGFKDHPLEVGSVGTRPTPEVVRTL